MLVPPVGLLAAWTYYKQGYVNFQIAALLCADFFLGGLLGAKLGTDLSNALLKKVFGAHKRGRSDWLDIGQTVIRPFWYKQAIMGHAA